MSEGKLAIIFVAGLVSGAVLETLTPATVLEAALIRVRDPRPPEPPRRSMLPLAWFVAGAAVSWAVLVSLLAV